MSFDLESRWALDPQVSIRPEPFGGLAYHYGTRRLSFLKSTALRDLVSALAGHRSAIEAIESQGIPDTEHERYVAALATLARTGMIRRAPVGSFAEEAR